MRDRRAMFIASLLIALALMLYVGPSAWAFYYESEIDPRVIYTWEVVEGTRVRADGTYSVISKNPDTLHLIKYILFKIYYPDNRLLTRYSYYKHDELFVYELDYGGYREGECYFVRIKPSLQDKEEIEGLLKPHLDGAARSLR